MAGADFIRRVGAPAIWSLSGEERTWRGHLETAIDPSLTLPMRRAATTADDLLLRLVSASKGGPCTY